MRLIDDGETLSLYVDDMDTPVLVGVDSTVFANNRVLLYNRETDTGSDAIDNLLVSGLPEAP